MDHTLPKDHKISLRCRHTLLRNSMDDRETAVIVDYRVPLGLPISQKKSIGMIKGIVYEAETLKPIGNLIVRINGTMAVTDLQGYFAFNALKPGPYFLSVDKSRVALNWVLLQKTPLEVNVKAGEETWLKLGFTEAAEFSGRVVVYPDTNHLNAGFQKGDGNASDRGFTVAGNRIENNNRWKGTSKNSSGLYDHEKEGMSQKNGLSNIMIELKRDGETLRRITDHSGGFTFEELRLGAWEVKIYDDHLPENHYLETKILNLNLAPGEKKENLIRVLPTKRRIRILQDGGILSEEKKGK